MPCHASTYLKSCAVALVGGCGTPHTMLLIHPIFDLLNSLNWVDLNALRDKHARLQIFRFPYHNLPRFSLSSIFFMFILYPQPTLPLLLILSPSHSLQPWLLLPSLRLSSPLSLHLLSQRKDVPPFFASLQMLVLTKPTLFLHLHVHPIWLLYALLYLHPKLRENVDLLSNHYHLLLYPTLNFIGYQLHALYS